MPLDISFSTLYKMGHCLSVCGWECYTITEAEPRSSRTTQTVQKADKEFFKKIKQVNENKLKPPKPKGKKKSSRKQTFQQRK